jgi:hypothetical protein
MKKIQAAICIIGGYMMAAAFTHHFNYSEKESLVMIIGCGLFIMNFLGLVTKE